MSRRELEDAIIRLQKLTLAPDITPVVEEAAQALASERDMEAEALIEKISARLRNDLQDVPR